MFVRRNDTKPSSALATFLALAAQTFRLEIAVSRSDIRNGALPQLLENLHWQPNQVE